MSGELRSRKRGGNGVTKGRVSLSSSEDYIGVHGRPTTPYLWLKVSLGALFVVAWCVFICVRFQARMSELRPRSEMDVSLPMYLFEENLSEHREIAQAIMEQFKKDGLALRVQIPKFGGLLRHWLVAEGEDESLPLFENGVPSFGATEDYALNPVFVNSLEANAPSIASLWRSGRLLLTQTCGYPLTHDYDDAFRVIGTPIYSVDGCDGPKYSSVILVQTGAADRFPDVASLRHSVLASNSISSQSGFHNLRAAVADAYDEATDGEKGFFGRVLLTGSHAASMEAVKSGDADVCAVDCVSYAILAKNSPEAVEGLAVLGFTPSVLALPLVTSPRASDKALELMQNAITEVFQGSHPALAELFIVGFERTTMQQYRSSILDMEAGVSHVNMGPARELNAKA